jgi:parallel beta-helix repeat protein
MSQKSLIKKAIILALTVLFSLNFASSANAATLTWTGGGIDNLASNPDNWSGNVVPQNGDDVVFDSTSSKDCTWDINVILSSLSLNPGYTGTVTLNSDLTVTGNVNILDGTFNQNNKNFTVGFVSFSPPIATTDPATDINGNAATLNATVNPNGLETTVYFEWGTDTSYGNTTPSQSIGSGTNDISVSAFINRLSTNTTYHYRVVATNAYGTTYGNDISFTTTKGTYVSGTISIDTTWTYEGSPYIVTGSISVYDTTSEPTLTIEPGVEVRFNGLYALYIGYSSYKGILKAQGTASKPIVFTSNQLTPQPGDWYGIIFYNHATIESILEYVTVEYGGYEGYGYSNITLQNSSLLIKNSTIRYSKNRGIYTYGDSSITITDSTISDNGTYGVYAGASGNISITGSTVSNNGTYGVYCAAGATISTTSFTNNGSYAISIPAYVSLGMGNTYSNNGNGIELRGTTISTDTTWSYQSVPYIAIGNIHVYDTTFEPTLTIEPGVEVRFNGANALYIGYSSYKGILKAQGTASKPIIFTSNKATPQAGDWIGIRFYNHASIESILEYVIVEYGGYGNNCNICLYSSSPTIKNSTIRYSKYYGIYSSGDSSLTITNSTISNNGTYGVYAGSTGSINITFSTISNNGNYAVYSGSPILTINHCNITGNGNGVYSPTGKIADARFNWWGDATGPSGQGPGLGQSVSSGIKFEPWLGTAYTYPFYNTDLSATLEEFSPLNNTVTYTFSISKNANWTFSIKDSQGTTVKTFTGSGTSGTVTWDGKDENDIIVSDGTYTYQLSSINLSNNSQSAPFIGDVVVGEGLPKAEITYPVDGQFIGNASLDIQGTATDSDFKDYKVEYSLGTAPETWTLIKSSTTPVDTDTLATWDPSNLTGTYYTIRLTVNDIAGNIATDSVEVKLLNIYSIAVSNPYFSPNEDGSKDTTTITASITYPSDWTVDIKNSSGTIIRTFTGTGDSISVTWDGKDTSGIIQPEGEYSCTITATEPSSSAVAIKDSPSNITIDLTPPVAEITSPVADEEVYETVTITGTAYDDNKQSHYLYYGAGTNPTTYTAFTSATSNVTNGTLGTWDTHDLENGVYTLKLEVMDRAGNSTETTVPVNVNNAKISDFTVSASFDPSSNQSSAISYTLSRGALVTIRIGTYSSFFRTLIQDAKRPAGENIDYWDGRDDNGDIVPEGTYIVAIYITTDPDPMPATAPRITEPLATPARFDPTTDAGATISYNLSKDAKVTVGIYDFNDNLIRNLVTNILQSQGSNSVIWDGKNESGNYVYPGAYRFKISATDSEGVTGPEITGIAQVYY